MSAHVSVLTRFYFLPRRETWPAIALAGREPARASKEGQ